MKKINLFLLFALLFSCSKDQTTGDVLNLKDRLNCLGLTKPASIINDKIICYDNDAILDIEEFSKEQSNDETVDFSQYYSTTRQKAINYNGLVGINSVASINYFIENSVSLISTKNGTWVDAIKNACTNWNDIQNCRVRFTQVSSFAQAQIGFFADNSSILPSGARNLPGNVVARACFPSNGLPGKYISINDQFDFGQFFLSIKQDFMRHEIGHTLGFHHTDNGIEDPYHTFSHPCNQAMGSNLIKGTAQSDSRSVMNFSTCGQQSNFSFYDQLAAAYLYPENYMTPEIINILSSNNGSTITIQTKTISSQLPYRAIVLRYNMSNVLQQSYDFYNPTANQSFSVSCPAGIWLFKVTYVNYGTFGFTSKSFPVINGVMEIKRKDAAPVSIDAKSCGNELQLYIDLNNTCQRFIFQLQNDGSYEVKRYDTNQNIDVINCGGAGTKVRLWDDYSNSCQRWKVSLESDGFFELKSKANNLNLDAAGCGSTAGTPLILWNDTNENCQRWSIY